MRRVGAVAAGLAAAGWVLAGCNTEQGLPTSQSRTGRPSSTSNSNVVVEEPSGSPSTSHQQPTGPVVTVDALHIGLEQGMSSESADFHTCVRRSTDTCLFEIFDSGKAQAEGIPVQIVPRFDPDDSGEPPDFGWALGHGDVPGCQGPHGEDRGMATRSTLSHKDFAQVGAHRAVYGVWSVTCEQGSEQVRVWWLPNSQLAILQRAAGGDASTLVDRLLADATWS